MLITIAPRTLDRFMKTASRTEPVFALRFPFGPGIGNGGTPAGKPKGAQRDLWPGCPTEGERLF